MAQTYSKLSKGQLASSTGTIYTAPASTKTYIKGMEFFNTSANSETIKIYEDGAGSSDQILERIVASKETFEWEPSFPIVLATGTTLRGASTNATTVNYFLYGMEEV